MPEEDNKMSKYNHGEKSMKHPFIICADLEFLLKKTDTCQNDLQKCYTEKKISIKLLVIQYLHIVHLMLQKIS